MQQQLSNLLLAQLAEPDVPDLFGFAPLTRRGFLLGSAVSGASLLASCSDDEPAIRSVGRGVELSYRGERWRIDPDAFASGARLAVERQGGGFGIRLSNARLAGTSLFADFLATVVRDGAGRWTIALEASQLAVRGSLALFDWLRGEGLVAGPEIAAKGLSPSLRLSGAEHLALSARQGLSLTLSAPQGMRLAGTLPLVTQEILLSPRSAAAPGERLARHASGRDAGAVTEFTVSAPALGARPPLRLPGRGAASLLQLSSLSRLGGELFDGVDALRSVLLAEGPARLWHTRRRGDAPLALQHGAVFLAPGRVALAGRIDGAQRVALGSVSARLAEQAGTLLAEYARGVPPRLTGKAQLHQLWIPQTQGAVSSLEFQAESATVTFGDPTEADGAAPAPPGEGEDSLGYSHSPLDVPLFAEEALAAEPDAQGASVAPAIRVPELIATQRANAPFLGRGIIETIPLDNSRLAVRRGEDLLNLIFAFKGFSLTIPASGWPRLKRTDMTSAARILLELPPQHLWETVFEKPVGCTRPGEDSQARLARPSRLAFSPKGNAWSTRELTFDKLLDWSELDLVVTSRAKARLAEGIDAQLQFAGIERDHALEQVFGKIRETFLPPTAQETALELASRLIFSPSENARWEQQERGNAPGTPLWNIRLDAVGRKSVRAIWSSYLKTNQFPSTIDGQGPADELFVDPAVKLALSPTHHWDVVAQTSLYGLPALRSIAPDTADATGAAVTKVPRANVVRPILDPRYLIEADRLDCRAFPDTAACRDQKNTGIAIAYPFDDADITLTGLGAIMHARWEGDPPHWRPLPERASDLKPLLPREVSLEQLDYQSWLGRDVRVVAIDKGFLFPLGIRASFVTVSERRFYPDANGNAVAYEVQRRFIRCRPAIKRFPALNQPFDARDFPAATLAMQTLTTPDLADPLDVPPAEQIGEYLRKIGGDEAAIPPQGAFWPRIRTAQGTRDFEFQWATETANGVTSPLIFVASGHIGREKRMAALAQYYRQLNAPQRTAKLHGARQCYAEELEEGEARFDTHSWLLSVRGQLFGDAAAQENFAIDARMNGASQPPFYPVVEQARIQVQPVDRLVGKPQGLVTVAYYDAYVRKGFGGENPSDIYLRVIEPRIAFDVQKRADVTGGASGPSAYVAALSRKTGIVGGSAVTPDSREPGQSFDIESAKAGNFSPAEFFGLEGGAKLLGLLDFAKLIDVVGIEGAPKLAENFGYGAMSDALPRVRSAARAARMASTAFFRTLETLKAAADAELQRISPGTKLKFVDLYPVFDRVTREAATEFDTALAHMEAATTPAALPDAASRLVRAAKPVLKEFDRLARDPLPPAADEVLRSFQTYWQTLRDLTAEPREAFVNGLLKLLVDALVSGICPLLDGNAAIGRVLFGASGADCAAFRRNPADVFAANAEALFRDMLAAPLAAMFAVVERHRAVSLHQVMFAEAALHDNVLRLLEQRVAAISTRLADYDAALRDVRDVKVRLDAARRITAALAKKLEEDLAALAFKQRLSAIESKFADGADTVVARELAILRDAIRPRASSTDTADSLLDEIVLLSSPKIIDAARQQLAARVWDLLEAIEKQARASKTELLGLVTQAAARSFETMLATSDFARVAQLGRQTADWCDQTVAVAQALGDRLIASSQTIELHRRELMIAVSALAAEPAWSPAIKQRFEDLRSHMTMVLKALASPLASLETQRARLSALDAGCATIPAALDPLQAILVLRVEVVTRLEELGKDLEAMPSVAAAKLNQIVARVGEFARDVTTIARLREASDLVVAARALIAALSADDGFRVSLTDALNQSLETAKNVDALLGGQTQAAAVKAALTQTRAYADGLERRLAALLLETVALEPAAAAALSRAAAKGLIAVAGPLRTYHRKLAQAFEQLGRLLDKPAIRPVVAFILGEARLSELHAHIANISTDDETLAAVVGAGESPDVFKHAATLRDRWSGTPSLLTAISMVADLIEDFVAGNLGNAVTLRLRQAIAEFGEKLREMVAQLVPTKVSIGYDWGTNLKDFELFRMLPPAQDVPAAKHLVLRTRASVDLVTGKREMVATGDLQPFELVLIGSSLDMARIQFNALHFESRNGESPKFDVSVRTVVLGDLLKFIEALQSYMAPEGNGFYLTPTTSGPGLETGYQFASSLIQVGSLSFLNVSLCVAARLYFDQRPAEFVFRFASAERPFIISNPPYGGGGYAEIVVQAGSPNAATLTLSFMFGGAAALKFGPLQAQGRIMAGIGVRKHREGTTLWALFEAVGEGSIACFSVSVSLRVTVWHYATGEMHGETRYRFTFKVGFLKYSYGVTATYRLVGGKKARAGNRQTMLGPRSPLAVACAQQGRTWFHKVTATPKNRNWAGYRRQIDHSLL